MTYYLLLNSDGTLHLKSSGELQVVDGTPSSECCSCNTPLCLREDAPNFYGVEFHMDFDVTAPASCENPIGFPRTIRVYGSATWTRFIASYTVSSSATIVIDGTTYNDEDFTLQHTCGFGRFVVDLFPAAPPNPSGITGIVLRLVFDTDGSLYSISFGNCLGTPAEGSGTATLSY